MRANTNATAVRTSPVRWPIASMKLTAPWFRIVATSPIKASALSALALTMVLYGCESLSENALVGPGERSEILITTTNGDGYTVARETDPSVGVVSAVIDQNGGALNIGKHSLTVPAGAHVVRLLPPLTVSEAELRRAVDLLQAELPEPTP